MLPRCAPFSFSGYMPPSASALLLHTLDRRAAPSTTTLHPHPPCCAFSSWHRHCSFYAAINVGALLASTVVVNVQTSVSWPLGFLIPAAAFALGLLAFLAGTRLYRWVAVQRSAARTCGTA